MIPTLSRRARAYLVAFVAACPVGLLLSVAAWGAQPGRAPTLALLFAALAALAIHFPLELTARYKVNVAGSVYFAALWLWGPPMAVLVVGAAELLGGCTLARRINPRSGLPRASLADTAFNAGQAMVAQALAGLVGYAFLPHVAPATAVSPQLALAMALAALVYYSANTAAVAGMVALQLGKSPWGLWRAVARQDAAPEAGLFLVGALAALTATDQPWAIALLGVPTATLYLALRRRVEATERTLAAIEALAAAVDVRDRYTGEHSARVAANAALLARALGLPADEVEAIRRAGRVHDLGKIAVPDRVLHQPGKLGPEEWALMRRHPETGYTILAHLGAYRQVLDLVRYHHERHDGKGYPCGVGGDALPIGAQILALCDTLDAMTSDRPYRKGLPLAVAREEIRRGAGAQFHPAVAAAFERLMAAPEQGLAISQAAAPEPRPAATHTSGSKTAVISARPLGGSHERPQPLRSAPS